MKYNPIFFIEKNIRGVWVVYGDIGVKQCCGYTKTQAKEKYRNEAWKTQGQFINQ